MKERTSVLLDNTTIAGAGRALYAGDLSTEGGEHARKYHGQFRDALEEDTRSLAEFLTALVLFDEIMWEGSSWLSQENADMHDLHAKQVDVTNAWVYRWFPHFLLAHNEGILRHHFTENCSMQLGAAQSRAVQWVCGQVQTGIFNFPGNFRIPLAYQDNSHPEWQHFEFLGTCAEPKLKKQYIPLALFLSRGLYYQSVAMREQKWSYLPHSFRASLIFDTEQQLASLLCAESTSVVARDVLDKLDERFLGRVAGVVKISKEVYRTISIGAAFLHKNRRDPLAAMEHAMKFRETTYGMEVRETFKDLLAAGVSNSTAALTSRLEDVDKTLRDYAIHKCGHSSDDLAEVKLLTGTSGTLKIAIEAALRFLPASQRDELMKLLYTPLTRPSGFQVLFGYYLPV